MEKLGVENNQLRKELLDEEANLMQKVQGLLLKHEKTASERAEEHSLNNRLSQVRARIYELDGKKMGV